MTIPTASDDANSIFRWLWYSQLTAWPSGGILAFACSDSDRLYFIAPDDELERRLVEYRETKSEFLKSDLLTKYGSSAVNPEGLTKTLTSINKSHATRKRSRLGLLPRDLQTELVKIRTLNSINDWRLLMAGVIAGERR